jgi:hypothetical protein
MGLAEGVGGHEDLQMNRRALVINQGGWLGFVVKIKKIDFGCSESFNL